MDAINRALTLLFDGLLWPLERLGPDAALLIASAIFGVLALLVFKHVSAQRRIKAVKDRIKAHLIEIRIYQDDLVLVSRAIGKVLARNLQYVGLNLLPFVPLALPFAFVLAQLVVRYGHDPLTSVPRAGRLLAGAGTTLQVELAPDAAGRIEELSILWPDGLEPLSPLARSAAAGSAWQEFVARAEGQYEIVLDLGGLRETKRIVAGGERPRAFQGERGTSWLSALLWPAERAFPAGSPFARVVFAYPERDSWLPGGAGGVVLTFLVASMLAGIVAIRPLKVQI